MCQVNFHIAVLSLLLCFGVLKFSLAFFESNLVF